MLSVLCFFTANAQDNFTGLTEPAFAVNIKTDSIWSFSFGAASRDVVYQNNGFDFEAKHIELNGLTTYALDKTQGFSLGFRYRFKDVFNSETIDEKSLIQQYGHVKKSRRVRFKERLRFEERFRKINSLRSRYRFGATFSLNQTEKPLNKLFLTAQTESLWSVGIEEKASFDQRVSLILAKLLSKATAAQMGLQYRYEDYTHQPSHKLFFVVKVEVGL